MEEYFGNMKKCIWHFQEIPYPGNTILGIHKQTLAFPLILKFRDEGLFRS